MADPSACALAVLAAGGSRRMGQAKQLLEIGGEPLVRKVVLTALEAGFHPAFVVLGAAAEQIRPRLEDLPVRIIDNPEWREGLASSLRAAVGIVAASPQLHGLIVTLADQPWVTADHLRALAQRQRESGSSMVASDYGSHLGPPVYFGREHFAALRALRGDSGARELLRSFDAASVPAPARMGLDLDTPADLDRLHEGS